MADSKIRVLINKVFMGVVTCITALCGASIGIIMGIIKGPTTETGLVRGACIGMVTGAITALQVLDMSVNGEPFSKVSLLCSLVNGQIITDWVAPAMLKAYLWQVNGAVESNFVDIFDMFAENNESKGLCRDSINKLPKCMLKNNSRKLKNESQEETSCVICLQSFKNKEEGRELPNCRHLFHLSCIDEWLIRNGSCPVCRRDV